MQNDNAAKHFRFSIKALPVIGKERLVIKKTLTKGDGVFLKKGHSFSKGDYVMEYSGRRTKENPLNAYTYAMKLKDDTIFIDASNKRNCNGKCACFTALNILRNTL